MRGRCSSSDLTCCISFKANSRLMKGSLEMTWLQKHVIDPKLERRRKSVLSIIIIGQSVNGEMSLWSSDKLPVSFTSHVSFTSLCLLNVFLCAHGGLKWPHGNTCHIITKCFSLLLRRTSKSRTSRPAGVTGWRSVPSSTPSSPLSSTTPFCRPSTVNTTLSWPLELQSEWCYNFSYIIRTKTCKTNDIPINLSC